MQKWFIESRRFEGTLVLGDDCINISFEAAVEDTGEVHIVLDPIARTPESQFISSHWEGKDAAFGNFILRGTASDGTLFHSDDLFFTTLNLFWDYSAGTMRPVADCTVARFTRPREREDEEGVRFLLRGLVVNGPLIAATPLGQVTVRQLAEHLNPSQISGEIRFSRIHSPTEQDEWLAKVDLLFDDLRHALSFALGLMITAPIREEVSGEHTTLLVCSSRSDYVSFMPPFQPNALKAFFAAAVKAHDHSPGDFRKLHFAITWLVMHAPYTEGRLIAAMTALENLISIHLAGKDLLIQSESQAKKLRRAVREAAQIYAEANIEDTGDRRRLLDELEKKMPDLNRRTLRQKIDILAERWAVSLADLDSETIDAAKKARDLIVHTGTFTGPAESELGAFTHMLVARELVVRFILAALSYHGSYGSYVGSYHKRKFSNGCNERSKW